MVELTLVRHGQAQTGARDEASYDRLSPLGEQQADWLGAHLAALGQGYDRVICGTLLRQRQTAQRVAGPLGLQPETDARLNEMDYFGLTRSLNETHALPFPTDRETFLVHIAEVLRAWEEGEIDSPQESFAAFRARVQGVVAEAEAAGGRVMLVTSGGVIGMAMRLLLRLDRMAHGHLLLQIENTSVHRYVKAGPDLVLDTFNAVPHLERAERTAARSYV
jgi:broad specificity phosphatase PhoE